MLVNFLHSVQTSAPPIMSAYLRTLMSAYLRTLLLFFICLVLGQTAEGQTVPQDGQKIPLGTDVLSPCSCEGNFCNLWPPPESGVYPQGFRTEMKKVTSFIERGFLIERQWNEEAGVGGAAVTENWEGGQCVKVNGSGGRTDEPSPAVFSITMPGLYRLRIITQDWVGAYDCGQPACSISNPDILKNETKIEDRYFMVDAEPEKGCNQPYNRIRQVTNADGNTLDDAARLSMGLGAPLIMRGQTVRIPSNISYVEVVFDDNSVIRFKGGSATKFNDCPDEKIDEPAVPIKMQISLIVGELWYKITKALNGEERPVQIQTERTVDGNRGTTFSIAYDQKSETTKVVVEEGSIWMRNKTGPVLKTLIVNAGQIGIQTGDQPPAIQQ